MNQKINSTISEKIPSYVPVYNKIYSDIINKVYLDEEYLPSESILTKEYNVSRHTLRQALTILSEDGLIRKQQGKGSIVTINKKNISSIQKDFFNPMIGYATEEIETIDINYNFAPPTEIASQKLNIGNNEILLASNNTYHSDKRIIGHSFIQIPVKHIESLKIDLKNNNAVSELLNTTIFKMTSNIKLSIRSVLAEEHINNFLKVSDQEPIIYLEEILFNNTNEPICRCKFYFLPDAYELNLWI